MHTLSIFASIVCARVVVAAVFWLVGALSGLWFASVDGARIAIVACHSMCDTLSGRAVASLARAQVIVVIVARSRDWFAALSGPRFAFRYQTLVSLVLQGTVLVFVLTSLWFDTHRCVAQVFYGVVVALGEYGRTYCGSIDALSCDWICDSIKAHARIVAWESSSVCALSTVAVTEVFGQWIVVVASRLVPTHPTLAPVQCAQIVVVAIESVVYTTRHRITSSELTLVFAGKAHGCLYDSAGSVVVAHPARAHVYRPGDALGMEIAIPARRIAQRDVARFVGGAVFRVRPTGAVV